MDKISIITVTYNCVNEVEKTIKDALSLEYPDYEVIVIDGASKDGTCELLNKYKEQFAYFVSEPDKGIYDAMNKGICAATGDWIIFQNVGDVFDGKDVLKRIFSKQWDDTDILYGDGQVVYASGLKYMKPWGLFIYLLKGFMAWDLAISLFLYVQAGQRNTRLICLSDVVQTII